MPRTTLNDILGSMTRQEAQDLLTAARAGRTDLSYHGLGHADIVGCDLFMELRRNGISESDADDILSRMRP